MEQESVSFAYVTFVFSYLAFFFFGYIYIRVSGFTSYADARLIVSPNESLRVTVLVKE